MRKQNILHSTYFPYLLQRGDIKLKQVLQYQNNVVNLLNSINIQRNFQYRSPRFVLILCRLPKYIEEN